MKKADATDASWVFRRGADRADADVGEIDEAVFEGGLVLAAAAGELGMKLPERSVIGMIGQANRRALGDRIGAGHTVVAVDRRGIGFSASGRP